MKEVAHLIVDFVDGLPSRLIHTADGFTEAGTPEWGPEVERAKISSMKC